MTKKFIPGEGQVKSGMVPAGKFIHHITVGSATTCDIVVGDLGVYDLIDVTEPIIVYGVYTEVVTAFTASVAMTLGDSADVDRYADNTNIGSTTAATGILVAATASLPMSADAIPVQIVVSGATVAAGLMNVYFSYSCLAD
jgi:hypothetical protein